MDDVSILALKLVEKYKYKPEVLDALLQVANLLKQGNYNFKEKYESNLISIRFNLAIRYNQDTADNIIKTIRREELFKSIIKKDYEGRELTNTLNNISIIGDHFINIFKNVYVTLNESDRLVLALLLVLKEKNIHTHGSDDHLLTRGIDYFDDIISKINAYINSIGVDEYYDEQRLETLLIKSGVANRLPNLWSSNKQTFIYNTLIEAYRLDRSKLLELLSIPKSYSIDEFITKLLDLKAYDELSILDELIQNNGIVEERDYNAGLPSWKGVIGKNRLGEYYRYIALSPFIYEELKDRLESIKRELNSEPILDSILELLKAKHSPKIVVNKIRYDINYWKLELGLNKPILIVTITPWINPKVAELSGYDNTLSLFFLTHQSITLAEEILSNYIDVSKTTLVSISNEVLDIKKARDTNPLIDEIIELFKANYKTQPMEERVVREETREEDAIDLSWMNKLIDKPSKTMGVYRTLLYIILRARISMRVIIMRY